MIIINLKGKIKMNKIKKLAKIGNDIINSDFIYFYSFFLLIIALTFPCILILLEIIGFTDNESLMFLLALIVIPVLVPIYLLYFLYVKKGLLWSLSFIIILSLIHYLRVQKFYGYDWYLLAIPIVLLIGGPLYAFAVEKINNKKNGR